jgi:hypothetical protein
MRMTLYHLAGSLQGKTQQFETDRVTFGTNEACGVRFDASRDGAVQPFHADLAVEHGIPILRDRTANRLVFVNGLRQAETALQDGDLIQFGESGPEVRFRLPLDGAPATKPLKTIMADSRDILVRTPHPRYLSPFYLGRHILSEIMIHASPVVRFAVGALLLAPLILILWLGVALYLQQQASVATERQLADVVRQLEIKRVTQAELEGRVEQERQVAAEFRRQGEEQIAALTAKLKAQEIARESRREIEAVRQQLSAIRQSQGFAEDIARRFGRSIGLLQGGYGFKEKATGRPLRYQGLDELGKPYVDKDGNALVTLEGIAPPVMIYFAGTAFLVDRAGTVVTNRHIVRMWEVFEPAQQVMAAGFEPEMTLLRLFLPEAVMPYRLTEVAISDRADIAILRTDRPPEAGSPVTLGGEDSPRIGEPVIMLSYPGTVDTLLARVAQATSREILAKAGDDSVKLIDELALRKLIRPLATQGHISDVSPELITYEAVSASGSSGAPIFNSAGKVIGVNQAMLQRIGGVHVALPVRFVNELIGSAARGNPRAE